MLLVAFRHAFQGCHPCVHDVGGSKRLGIVVFIVAFALA
jgi:hypothetical protein